jgi:hypothetical protein
LAWIFSNLIGTFVEELRAEEVSNALQDQPSRQHVENHGYPENYETCYNFFWLLKKAVQVGMQDGLSLSFPL